MKKGISFLLFLILFSCSEDKINTSTIHKWEKTNVSFSEAFMKSFSNDNKLYLLFSDKLVTVDDNLNTKIILTFNQETWFNPFPILSNEIFGISELKSYSSKDSAFFNFFSVANWEIKKYTLNFSKLRLELSKRSNVPFNLDLAAINNRNRIFMVIPSFTTNTYIGVTFDIEILGNQMSLKNKNIFPINDVEPLELRTITSVGKDFYLSTYNKTFRIDQNGSITLFDNNAMIGKPFFFLNKWHMKTYSGYFESIDEGISWTRNDSYNYSFVYPLGTYKERLYFTESETQYCKYSINWTDDLKLIKKVEIENEATNSCYTRLKLIDKYLYSLDTDNALNRFDVGAIQK